MAGNVEMFSLMSEFLDSSSSSGGDEDLVLTQASISQEIAKVKNYMDVINEYFDKKFRRNFSLPKRTYDISRLMFENLEFYSKGAHGGNPDTPAEIQLLSFLWFAGNKCVIQDVAGRFGIAESTFHSTCTNVMNFLNNAAPKFIEFPANIEGKRQISSKFEEISGFPNVIGCIDGTCIPIRRPAHKIKSTYVNRHDQSSITLHVICDADKVFLDVFTGPPSEIHDACIVKMSFISNELEDICADKWHLLGDAAYPLKTWLITPYRDYGNLTEAERNFNFKHSSTRVKIENAFGLLEQRFRHLQRTEFLTVDAITKFIVFCCVLHNLCIVNGDLWEEFNAEQNENPVVHNEQDHPDVAGVAGEA